MLPAQLLSPKGHHMVLDMCCAPGSKTLQLLDMMHTPGHFAPFLRPCATNTRPSSALLTSLRTYFNTL
jgi:hypothetical protein